MSGQGDSCLSCWHQEVSRSEVHGRGVFGEWGVDENKSSGPQGDGVGAPEGGQKGASKCKLRAKAGASRGGSFRIVSRCLRKPSRDVAIC